MTKLAEHPELDRDRELTVEVSGYDDDHVFLFAEGRSSGVHVSGPALRDEMLRRFPLEDERAEPEVDVTTDRDVERLIAQARTRAVEDFNQRLAAALKTAFPA